MAGQEHESDRPFYQDNWLTHQDSWQILDAMELTRQRALFGTRRRSEVLILIALLGETYPSEIARQLGAPIFSVQTVVDSLERDGIVASRKRGGTRVVALDPRFYAAKELRRLLLRLADGEPGLQEASTARRSRPRRRGKAI